METFIIPYWVFFTPVQRICSPSWELKSDGKAVAFFFSFFFIIFIYFFQMFLCSFFPFHVTRVLNGTLCGKRCSDLTVTPLIYVMESERSRHRRAQRERPRNKMCSCIWSCVSIAVFPQNKSDSSKILTTYNCDLQVFPLSAVKYAHCNFIRFYLNCFYFCLFMLACCQEWSPPLFTIFTRRELLM